MSPKEKGSKLPPEVTSYVKSASLTELADLRELISAEAAARVSTQRTGRILTYTDGASRGNPGQAGIGALIFDEKGEKILQDYRYLGICTNNEAEYRALLLALERASEITQGDVACHLDSELTVRQLNGQYAVKSEKLAQFNAEVRRRMARFRSVTFTHLPREHARLRLADQLANRAIDEAKAGPPPASDRID